MKPDYPRIALLPGHQRRALSGHPWAYSNEVAMTAEARSLAAGSLIELVTDAGRPIGIAGFNPHALIAARIITRDPAAAVDAGFLAGRLQTCVALRDRLFADPFYRLVHAEADAMPGLVIDRYGDAFSMQLNSAVFDRLREALLDAVESVFSPRRIVLRNDSPARRLEGLESNVETVKGDSAEPVELQEYGVRFLADLAGGQKTGWFYDQRDNRHFVASLARDARVLDVYSHTGGFALHALAGGAHSVAAVDSSADALALAGHSAALNGFAPRFKPVRAEAFSEMQALGERNETFDIVVADPPAFVKSKKDLKPGLQGYRKVARLAARLVRPGGILFVASCSHNVSAELFDEQVRKGLADARRPGRVLRRAGAAPDHPLHPWLPESGYLKSLTLQLD